MQKDAFDWDPDGDQVYDGYVYGSMTLSDRPFSAFSKTLGKSFAMDGDDGDGLTLLPDFSLGDPLAVWGEDPRNPEASLSRMSINGGTLVLRSKRDVNAPDPYDEGVLMLGGEDPPGLQKVLINVKGRFLIQDTNVEGQGQNDPDLEDPCATINVYSGGVFEIGQTRPDLPAYWTGAYTINIYDFSAMSVTTNIVSLNDGKCVAQGVPPEEGDLSLEITVLPSSNPNSGKGPGRVGSLAAARQIISCRSSARARMQASAMYYTDTRVRVEDSSGMFIVCDTIELDSATVFSVGHGSASITFEGTGDGRAPFAFVDKTYPEGIFNFVTTQGPNVGRLRFRGIGSAFDFAAMVQRNLITVDGVPVSQSGHQCDWTMEGDGNHFNDRYFVVFLKQRR